jgi:hypothetical protein
MNPLAIIALIEGLISVGTDAVTAWNTISAIVAAKRDPTPAEWALANLQADVAHNAVQTH